MTLDNVLSDAFRRLEAGVADHAAPFHLLGLGTVADGGLPELRIVVLRGFDGAARRLIAHTDARSGKFAQLQTNPAVALLGWDPMARLQIRLRGTATLHAGDAAAQAAWGALSHGRRQLYRLRQSPGTALPDPSPHHYSEAPESVGFAAFAIVAVVFDEMETLLLADGGQERARFRFAGDGVAASWLVP